MWIINTDLSSGMYINKIFGNHNYAYIFPATILDVDAPDFNFLDEDENVLLASKRYSHQEGTLW